MLPIQSACDVLSAPYSLPPNGGSQTSQSSAMGCPVVPRVDVLERQLRNQTRILAVVVGAVSLVAPQVSQLVSAILSFLGK